jgi:hypothetical protein
MMDLAVSEEILSLFIRTFLEEDGVRTMLRV